LWDAILGYDAAPKTGGFSKADRDAAREREAARDLEERTVRLQVSKAAVARLPHHILADGSVATSHRIRGNRSFVNHAVALGKWKAACGASPWSSSWSTALDDVVSCPRCLKKIAATKNGYCFR
jgi:hypothetical protein